MTIVQRQASSCYEDVDQLTFWCTTFLYFVSSNDLFYYEVTK